MDQAQARRRARELAGEYPGTPVVAIGARPRPSGGYLYGGWPNQKDETWVVAMQTGSGYALLDAGEEDQTPPDA